MVWVGKSCVGGGDDGWKKFKKALMCAVFGYSKAYGENKGAYI